MLAYHGRHVPMEELRNASGVSRDGTSADTLCRVARRYGLLGNGYRREPAQLKELGFPLMAHCRFNHFVVVEGMTARRVLLNDPLSGAHDVPVEEFDDDFTGVVLTFGLAPDFVSAGRPFDFPGALTERFTGLGKSSFRLAFGLARKTLAISPLLGLLGIASAVLLQLWVDEVLAGHNGQRLVAMVLGLAAASILAGALSWWQHGALATLESTLARDWTRRVLLHVTRMPARFFSYRFPAVIQAAVESNAGVARLMCGELATAALGLVSVPLIWAAMFWYDPRIGAASIALSSLNLLTGVLIFGRRTSARRRFHHAQGAAGGFSAEQLEHIESLKVGGSIAEAFGGLAGRQATWLSAEQEFGQVLGIAASVTPLVSSLSTLCVLGFGAIGVMHGRLTVGAVVALCSLSAMLIARQTDLLAHAGELDDLRENLVRIENACAVEPEIAVPEPIGPALAEGPTARLSGHLEVLDLSFGYTRAKPPLLDGVCFELAPGIQLGIIGRPGSGKSTLARVICGLDEPWSGSVRLDGRPVRSIPQSVLARSLALVDRDAFLFDGTVEENVRLWDDRLLPEALEEALQDACLDDVIKARSGGCRHRIAPGGTNFSGGQRQRLEIARALIRDPSLLVLDEATEALDPDLEAAIRRNIRRRRCACIIISLRPSTIRGCDEILVLDGGRIVQRGAHTSLAASDGPYRQLIARG